jgi:hypothetical protein
MMPEQGQRGKRRVLIQSIQHQKGPSLPDDVLGNALEQCLARNEVTNIYTTSAKRRQKYLGYDHV